MDARWLAHVRERFRHGREAFLSQDHARALEVLTAAIEEADGRLDRGSRLDPVLVADFVHACMTLARSMEALGVGDRGEWVLELVARRFPDFPLTEAEYPKPLIVGVEERRQRARLRSGSVDVDVVGRSPGDLGTCSIHLDGAPRGYHPVSLEGVPIGPHVLTAVCGEGAGRAVGRPLRLDLAEGRTRVTIVAGGDEAVERVDPPDVAVRLRAGWSLPGPAPRGGQALALRTGADAALLVGPDPAAEGGGVRVRLVRADGGGPSAGIGLAAGEAESVVRALVEGEGIGAGSASAALLWSSAGLAAAGAVAAALAWSAHGHFESCRDEPACYDSDEATRRRDSVEARSLAADVLLGTAAAAAVVGGIVWIAEEPAPP